MPSGQATAARADLAELRRRLRAMEASWSEFFGRM